MLFFFHFTILQHTGEYITIYNASARKYGKEESSEGPQSVSASSSPILDCINHEYQL